MVEVLDIETQFDNQFTRQFGFPKERLRPRCWGCCRRT